MTQYVEAFYRMDEIDKTPLIHKNVITLYKRHSLFGPWDVVTDFPGFVGIRDVDYQNKIPLKPVGAPAGVKKFTFTVHLEAMDSRSTCRESSHTILGGF
jgi:hypothetical protein